MLDELAQLADRLMEVDARHRPTVLADAMTGDVLDALAAADPGEVEAAMMRLEAVPGVATRVRKYGAMVRRRAKVAKRREAIVPVDDSILEAAGIEVVHPEPDVLALMTWSGGRTPKIQRTIRNAVTILQQDTRWAGRITRNDLKGTVELDDDLYTDGDTGRIRIWLEEVYGLVLNKAIVDDAVTVVAEAAAYHPIREYLDGIEWDGTPRVRGMLRQHFGVIEEYNAELIDRLSECFLVSCVARIMQPGCKVDTSLILTGRQGRGKSSALEALAIRPEWFSDSAIAIGTKDAYQSLRGVWIYELAELDSINRRDAGTIKAFITSKRDKYRPSYGRYDVEVPRQVVFTGTTNKDQFLRDETGSRRFWPVRVTTIDLPGLRRDAPQLWAEAVALYNQGTTWHLSPEQADELAEYSEQYRESDIWEHPIAEWAEGRAGRFTGAEILKAALDIEVAHANGIHGARLRTILNGLGWTAKRARSGGRGSRRVTVWEPPEDG